MKSLQKFLFHSVWMAAILCFTAALLMPTLARAQSNGTSVDVCYGMSDIIYGLEESGCLYGDSSDLSGWVEVYGPDADWENIVGVGAEAQLFQGPDGDILISDSGVQYAQSFGEPTVLVDSGPGPISGMYTMQGDAYALWDPSGQGDPSDASWTDEGSEEWDVNVTPSYQGYIDPKYIVLGVTYAPPGPASSVTYSSSATLGTTDSIADSRSTGTTYSVSIANNIGIGSWKVGTNLGYSNTATQMTKDTQTTTLNWSTTNILQTFGTPTAVVNGAFTSPVDHDYDVIYVWLNPVEVLTLAQGSIVWNGYGYDATDQNGMDIIPIPLGYLNGDFGAMPPGILSSTNRVWAANQIYGSGQSAALDSADFAAIAQSDPFSDSSYGTNEIGSSPPSPTTPDNRFTLTVCNDSNSVSFGQAAPSQSPDHYTCTLQYSDLTTNAKALTTSSSNTFSLDRSYSGSLFQNNLTLDFKYSNMVSTTHEVDSSISSTQATSSSAAIIGLSCNNSQPYVGPCIPVYTGPPQLPTQFMIYQDDLYGTFMFAPLDYY